MRKLEDVILDRGEVDPPTGNAAMCGRLLERTPNVAAKDDAIIPEPVCDGDGGRIVRPGGIDADVGLRILGDLLFALAGRPALGRDPDLFAAGELV